VCSTTLDVGSLDEGLRRACDAAFELWLDRIVAAFEASGATPNAARPLAIFVLSALEGAIVLARAAKSPEALIDTGRLVRETVDRAAEGWC
jgi:TetR/AcrR family transcriptional repressor of lmrAB and yxaGH operons